MIPERLLLSEATWLVPGSSSDMYGNTLPDWDTATSTTTRVRLEQLTRDEQSDETRDALVATFKMFTNETGIRGRDRITIGGITYEVDGPPDLVTDRAGTHHLEATVRWVAG